MRQGLLASDLGSGSWGNWLRRLGLFTFCAMVNGESLFWDLLDRPGLTLVRNLSLGVRIAVYRVDFGPEFDRFEMLV